MVIVLLMVLSGGPIVNPISDDWKSTEGDRGGCIVASKGGVSSTGPGSDENHVADDCPGSDENHVADDWSGFSREPCRGR